jgi:glycosyltransferase involved in cell wall biosynthesis
MRLTYVTRSFLDYRVPVYEELAAAIGGELTVIYSDEVVPQRVTRRLRASLGDRVRPLAGERRIGPREFADFANTSFRFVYQPGLQQAIRDSRPDVVVGDGFFQWTLHALLQRIQHGTPLVVCYERTAHTERGSQLIRRLYRRAVSTWTDAVSCSGELCARYVTDSMGIPPERLTLGHMVADVHELPGKAAAARVATRESLRREWGSPELVLLVVGRLIERKGLRELVQAWAKFPREPRRDWRLVLTGDGPEGPALQAYTRQAGLDDVVLTGPVDYSRIADFYAAADVLVSPTLEDNWSLVVPEGMSTGLPVLCSIYNGCYPELVHEGVNGWRYDPLVDASAVDALHRIAADRHRLGDMGRASVELVALHTPAHAARAIVDACRVALQRRGRLEAALRPQ